jgi:(S)-2-hydroxyglutarate dehydrogenase
MQRADYLIIGAGVMGLACAWSLRRQNPAASILVIEKEDRVAVHASGRNSGVLHAGFYYTADSLKARFCAEGNRLWSAFCEDTGLPIRRCGKLVLAANEAELESLYELKRRGDINGVETELLSEAEAKKLEPLINTHGKALYSPSTATIDPVEICSSLQRELSRSGVKFFFNTSFKSASRVSNNFLIRTSRKDIETSAVINCAGLYADRVAQKFGFANHYTVVPFRGSYRIGRGECETLKMHIYPVPDLLLPFLGVHFSKRIDGGTKLGPTSTPAFWREHYGGVEGFQVNELAETSLLLLKLFANNSFNFRALAKQELRKSFAGHFARLASSLVPTFRAKDLGPVASSAVRAQLLDKRSYKLVQDFVVEGDENSVHVLNAVSPGFTSALPFADFVIERLLDKDKKQQSASSSSLTLSTT